MRSMECLSFSFTAQQMKIFNFDEFNESVYSLQTNSSIKVHD